MKQVVRLGILAAVAVWAGSAAGQASGCMTCHQGIEPFSDGPMQLSVVAIGNAHGDPAGCVTCHGGDPTAADKEAAHAGSPASLAAAGGPHTFYPNPSAVWIADKSCGQCHQGYAERLIKSLMNIEAGKIQGNLWSWGVQESMKVVWGNYDLSDEDGPVPAIDTDAYRKYMQAFVAAHPDQMPSQMKQIPEVDPVRIPEHPNLAGITYSRQRCHVGVTGREKRGDFRGGGCSSCHVPYSNEGRYEGGDPTIAREQPGKLLVHRMQGTRKSKIRVGHVEYTGIPSETCNSCHNRGKRIGVSYQGLMEFPYGSPYSANRRQATEAAYQELPLHQGRPAPPGTVVPGESARRDALPGLSHHGGHARRRQPAGDDARAGRDRMPGLPWHRDPGALGAAARLRRGARAGHRLRAARTQLAATPGADVRADLSAAGRLPADRTRQPLRQRGEEGLEGHPPLRLRKRLRVPVLKAIANDSAWKSRNARVAMSSVGRHMESMECYACHADWAPQCDGCHITVDYSEGRTDMDWITTANAHDDNGLTADNPLGTNGLTGPGKVFETRSYLRWEEPTLGINGEGRVSPLMPGCQVITTVIDKDGNTVAHNEIRTTPDGKKGLDHAAVQPHTAGRGARTCESCHNNPKAPGYGISGGRFLKGYEKGFTVELETAFGQIIPGVTQLQSQPVPELDHDLSRIVTPEGEVLVTVGSHWPLTGPLTAQQREKMERTGLCMGCHQNMTDEDLWAKVDSSEFVDNQQHQDVMDRAVHALAEKKGAQQAR